MEEGAKNRRRSVEDYLRLLECIVLTHFFFKANCECRVLFKCSNVPTSSSKDVTTGCETLNLRVIVIGLP